MMSIQMSLKKFPPTLIYSRRMVMQDFPHSLPELLRTVMEEVLALGGEPSGPPIVLYYDQEFNPQAVDLEVAWPVAEPRFSNRTIPAVQAVVGVHIGSYESMGASYEQLYAWIQEQGYRPLIPMWEIYLSDPRTTRAEELETEIVVPVEKNES